MVDTTTPKDRTDLPQSKSAEAGAPINEVEITPAMREAGLRSFRECDRRVESDWEIVEDIFCSMIEAMRDDKYINANANNEEKQP